MRFLPSRQGRGGHADPSRWPDDGDRPLSSRGEDKTVAACHGLARLAGGASRILTSPLVRAERSARLLADTLDDSVPVESLDALAPGGGYRKILDHLALVPSDETVVLVGHEPSLGKLAGMLLFGAPAALPLKKAGACAIRFEGPPQAGHGELVWFMPPRALRRLAGRKSKV
jgi:phosphohistidine phosphatase